MGLDVGIKDFAILNNGQIIKNINKSSAIKKTEKRLKCVQHALSRKYEWREKRGENPAMKSGRNIEKNVLRIKNLLAVISLKQAQRHVVLT
ncbi:hypothetical protein DL897_06080 [Thermoflavimicrobium daqui]|uniref:Transposase n=1 Tax=Thermoflavimicrobium daqui TaxID=2137476 RepID=A0A364K5R1_9BACL|nr:hypothetical protein DL897_06080 [Thermoflavimicrobium daqui]